MAFFPELLGWPVEDHQNDWTRAAHYFFARTKELGTTLPAWQGHYQYLSLGGIDEDAIDLYCYEPYETEETPQVSIHFHMSGPSVWQLHPIYPSVEDLPPLLDQGLLVQVNGNYEKTLLPIEVMTRHMITPQKQIEPFLAQMCFLPKHLRFFKTEQAYEEDDAIGLKISIGSCIAPGILTSLWFSQETEPSIEYAEEDIDKKNSLLPEERLVLLCASVTGYEELLLHQIPFLYRIQLATHYGSLTIFANKHMIQNPPCIGDLCYAEGFLSGDIAIYENACGYGN